MFYILSNWPQWRPCNKVHGNFPILCSSIIEKTFITTGRWPHIPEKPSRRLHFLFWQSCFGILHSFNYHGSWEPSRSVATLAGLNTVPANLTQSGDHGTPQTVQMSNGTNKALQVCSMTFVLHSDLKLPMLFSKQIASEVASDPHGTKPLPVERQFLSLLRSASFPYKHSLPY